MAGLERWVGAGQKEGEREGEKGKAGQKVSESMAAKRGPAARRWYGSYLCNLPHMSVSLASPTPPPPSLTHPPTHRHTCTQWGGATHFFVFFFSFTSTAGYEEINPHLPLLFSLSLSSWETEGRKGVSGEVRYLISPLHPTNRPLPWPSCCLRP